MKQFKFDCSKDKRGLFKKLVSYNFLKKEIKEDIAEINLSYNKKKGTIRGFHYQIGKFKELKIIYVLQGKILDIAIDLKKNVIEKKILHGGRNTGIIIKKDYAHGFQTLEDDTIILYLHTKKYNPKMERTINPLHNQYNIKWPIKISNISQKDLEA